MGGAMKKFFNERRAQRLREAQQAEAQVQVDKKPATKSPKAKRYNVDGRAWFGRIMKEASAQHFKLEQVVVHYGNRMSRVSRRLLDINGMRCHTYHVRDTRVAGEIRYAMLGITREALQTCAFAIVHIDPAHGNDEILVIPSSDLLAHYKERMMFKRFYISLEQIHGIVHPGGRPATVEWSRYRSAWHLLATPADASV